MREAKATKDPKPDSNHVAGDVESEAEKAKRRPVTDRNRSESDDVCIDRMCALLDQCLETLGGESS